MFLNQVYQYPETEERIRVVYEAIDSVWLINIDDESAWPILTSIFDFVAPDLLRASGKNPIVKKTPPKFKTEIDEDGNEIQVGVKKKKPTEKSELLFLALILRMLKVGGRATVIIPEGLLFGSTKAHKSV